MGLTPWCAPTDPQRFGETLGAFANRFAWFGTPKPFDTLTQTFIETPHGALNAHHYRYALEMSTFIVEAEPKAFAGLGFDGKDEAQSAQLCAELFADTLAGAPLLTNRSQWRQFPKLWCRSWVAGNRVLLGDAAHTAHFSIGSGTRLAMEDAIALTRAIASHDELTEALRALRDRTHPDRRENCFSCQYVGCLVRPVCRQDGTWLRWILRLTTSRVPGGSIWIDCDSSHRISCALMRHMQRG